MASRKVLSGAANNLDRSIKSRVSKQVLIVCESIFFTQHREIAHRVLFHQLAQIFLDATFGHQRDS